MSLTNKFKNISITQKIALLIVLASMFSVVLVTIAFSIYNLYHLRAKMIENLTVQTSVIKNITSAAVAFNDNEFANKSLSSLKSDVSIMAAQILLNDDNYLSSRNKNNLFATYLREDLNPENISYDYISPPKSVGSAANYKFFNNKVVLHDIVSDAGEIVGSIIIYADLSPIYNQFYTSLIIAGLTFIVVTIASILLSLILQKIISKPIIDLVQTMASITETGNYDATVNVTQHDEIGLLTINFNNLLKKIDSHKKILSEKNVTLEQLVKERTQTLVQIENTNLKLESEIEERIKAEKEVSKLHKKMLETSRDAGMSEVATSILHNVGNVLNSVNTSTGLIQNNLTHSKLNNLIKATQQLELYADDFLKLLNTEKGCTLLNYICNASAHIKTEHDQLLEETIYLLNNIDHIKKIINDQQAYAKKPDVIEAVNIAELINESLGFVSLPDDIIIEQQYEDIPAISIAHHKVLQIVTNLLSNAKHAVINTNNIEKKINISTNIISDMLSISIQDNGVGISSVNLTKIFAYGFTTKENGHGFGLHSCANLAKEMKGELTVHSDGVGYGSTFCLELPINTNVSCQQAQC